jgi:Shedu protein SduA, C-terminal
MTTESLDQVRTMLAQDFEHKADWRDAKAAEYPEDERNERAAEGLRELAAYVRTLPDDDPRLQAIDSAWHTGDADPTAPDMILTSYGFGPGSHLGLPDSDRFLSQYAEEWSRQVEIESVYKEDPDRILRLITHDHAEIVRMFRRLLDDPEYFDGFIPPGRGPEAVWQKFLEENRWILGGSLAGQFLTSWNEERLEQIVAGFSIASVGKRTDALLRTAGRVQSMVFVEIKHHRTELLGEEYRPGCWAPSKEMCGGVAQVQGTVQRAVDQISDRLPDRASDGSEIPGAFTYLLRPRSFLIVGSLNEVIGEAGGISPDKYLSFELYRRHMEEPDIITFDELLARAEGLVEVADV